MTTAIVFSTGLCTVAAIIALTCAWIALGAVQQAHKVVEGVRELKGRVVALEAEAAAMQMQHQKLRGKVYAHFGALPREPVRGTDPVAETPEQVRARLRGAHGLPKLGPLNGKLE